VALPHHILYRLPDGLSFRHAALVEPLAIAMHAVSRLHLSLDDTAVVVGAGVIGLLAVQVLRAAGCGQIIAADLDQRRLDLACKLGADQGLRSDVTDVCAEVMRQTDNRGADLSVEAVGIAPTVQLAAGCLRRGGQLALVGILAPRVEFPVQDIVTRELTITGSYCSCEDYPACLDLMVRGTIQVEPLISAVARHLQTIGRIDRLGRLGTEICIAGPIGLLRRDRRSTRARRGLSGGRLHHRPDRAQQGRHRQVGRVEGTCAVQHSRTHRFALSAHGRKAISRFCQVYRQPVGPARRSQPDPQAVVQAVEVRDGLPKGIRLVMDVPFAAADGQTVLVRMCDYASAGRTWSEESALRVWLPQPLNLEEPFKP